MAADLAGPIAEVHLAGPENYQEITAAIAPAENSATNLGQGDLSPALAARPAEFRPTAKLAASELAASSTEISAYLENGYLRIIGSNAENLRDQVIVRHGGVSSRIDVALRVADLAGNILFDQTLSFSLFTMPNGIWFQGRDGHDFFSNMTSVKSIAEGGRGNDWLIGGSNNDRLVGGDGDDVLDGRDGDDVILGEAGNDTIYGGAGHDTLVGGMHNDRIYGGSGNDFIDGGGGADYLRGDAGDDEIHGGTENDVIWGGAGNDRIFGGHGNDEIYGDELALALAGGGNDTIYGGAGRDQIFAHSGNDVVYGGKGDDDIRGGTGNDRLYGEDGLDRLIGDEGDDYLDGGNYRFRDLLRGGAGRDTFVVHKSIFGGPGGPESYLDTPERTETKWHW